MTKRKRFYLIIYWTSKCFIILLVKFREISFYIFFVGWHFDKFDQKSHNLGVEHCTSRTIITNVM